MARLTKTKAKKAIDASRGNMSKAAESAGVSRRYFYKFCQDKYPDLWDYVQQARESIVDDLEDKAYDVAMRGNNSMLQFLLKNLGRTRGYADRLEQTSKGEQVITVRYDRSQPIHTSSDTETD